MPMFDISRKWRELRAEPSILLALGVAAGLGLALAKIIEDVVEHESGTFDEAILRALRVSGDLSRPIGPAWLEHSVKNITALGSPTVLTLLTLIAVAYLVVAGRRRVAGLVAIGIVGGSIAEKLMKSGFDRARPDVVPHLVDVTSLSFPSGHAMLSAITYLTVGALLAHAQAETRLRIFAFCTGLFMTLIIGLSRIYLGVHYPTDVLAGWCAGSLWALLFWLIARRFA